MHPTLVSIVRERMRSQTTEQLLDLWVTNDRASWSPEAFEAVKQLLAERGQTELPAQSDPAPLGRRWSASDHPDAAYGMSWLRPILWICIVAGSVALAKAPALVWVFVKNSSGIPLRFYDLGRPRIFMEAVVVGILLPLWLVVASVAALRVRRWARPALLLYALVATRGHSRGGRAETCRIPPVLRRQSVEHDHPGNGGGEDGANARVAGRLVGAHAPGRGPRRLRARQPG